MKIYFVLKCIRTCFILFTSTLYDHLMIPGCFSHLEVAVSVLSVKTNWKQHVVFSVFENSPAKSKAKPSLEMVPSCDWKSEPSVGKLPTTTKTRSHDATPHSTIAGGVMEQVRRTEWVLRCFWSSLSNFSLMWRDNSIHETRICLSILAPSY